ncbi:hypothetical protein HY991_04235 [Candidatus Micrarchaeota archaeon]|nr:hypothetical protein [Candidatus Micrarchaeota archaeon]
MYFRAWLLIGFFFTEMLLFGCLQTQESRVSEKTVLKYVCPDGSLQNEPSKCPTKTIVGPPGSNTNIYTEKTLLLEAANMTSGSFLTFRDRYSPTVCTAVPAIYAEKVYLGVIYCRQKQGSDIMETYRNMTSDFIPEVGIGREVILSHARLSNARVSIRVDSITFTNNTYTASVSVFAIPA